MGFDDQFVEQVRNSISIVDFINRYLPLKKSGKDHGALCPFHSEKTPSFWVSEDKQIFKCFGCGEGGDVFSFVMKMENMPFPEAVRFIAESAGIPVPRSAGGQGDSKELRRKQRLVKLAAQVSRLFHQALKSQGGENTASRYLRRREISPDTVSKFEVGYAPPGNWLLQQLRSQGFSNQEAVACGLAKENERGVYSYFRDRVIFPIRDINGRTIAFGGRILGEGKPKYLNSPESPLYNKSRHLYGLDVARDAIRSKGEAILVEGYFDCVVPHQFGFDNVVASLGTSLTEEQVKVLRRYASRVVLNYDPDLAGAKAALRSIELLMGAGLQVAVIQLPDGSDPDTFIREQGREVYEQRIHDAQPFLDYLLGQLSQQQEAPDSPRGKQEIVTQVLPYLMLVADKIERAEHLSRLAQRLRIDERLIWNELRQYSGRRKGDSAPHRPSVQRTDLATRSEKILLAAVLQEEWRVLTLELVDRDLFRNLETEPVFRLVLDLHEQGREPDLSRLRSLLGESPLLDLSERMAFGGDLPVNEDTVRGSVLALRIRQNQRLQKELQARLRNNELDPQQQMEVLQRRKSLIEESRDLMRRSREMAGSAS
ncbi:MAG TPA: DNA primase [Acidobacteriota bacterium]|nr:DNA primase [Acidobacteriota bacterium]